VHVFAIKTCPPACSVARRLRLIKIADFSPRQGKNRSNTEVLRGFLTQYRRKRRIFMSQEERNTTPALALEYFGESDEFS
jgi:hypothetical protein